MPRRDRTSPPTRRARDVSTSKRLASDAIVQRTPPRKFGDTSGESVHSKNEARRNGSSSQDHRVVVSKSEYRMRHLLTLIFPGEQRCCNTRPPWLKGMELDVFYPHRKIAFEFNGPQHYRLVPRFHKSTEDLISQQARDSMKSDICKAKGIRLIVAQYDDIKSLESLLMCAVRQM